MENWGQIRNMILNFGKKYVKMLKLIRNNSESDYPEKKKEMILGNFNLGKRIWKRLTWSFSQ